MTVSDKGQRGGQTGAGLWEPRERGGCPLFSQGCGCFLRRICCRRGRAVASLEPRVSGCLSAELAGQQPRAAGCNYALQLQRKLLAAGACAGPGCTLAAGREGTMEIETSGSRRRGGAGRGRRQAGRERETGHRLLPGLNAEKPTSALPGSGPLFAR